MGETKDASGLIKSPEFKSKGEIAIMGTNETAANGFFEAVQDKNPNGYIVGVGAGNVFTMLHCFKEGVMPQGMILADTDPRVVAVGRLFIKKIKDSKSGDEFKQKLSQLSFDEFQSEIEKILGKEKSQHVKAEWEKILDQLQKDMDYPLKWSDGMYKHEGQRIDVFGAILAKFEVLKKLADSDKIKMTYCSFTKREFIGTVKSLPGFQSSINLIYLSNIADHFSRARGNIVIPPIKYPEDLTDDEEFIRVELEYNEALKKAERVAAEKALEPISSLKAYENYQAIFIDTLQSLNYYLRVSSGLPEFTGEDVVYKGIVARSQKPKGLFFGKDERGELNG